MLNVSNAIGGAAQASTLGTIADSSSTLKKGMDAGRRRRYKLLKAARKLLPDERIAQCQHSIAPECRIAEVRVSDTTDRVSFKNLIRCDSPQCPFCSVARSERDRHELSIALAQAQAMGYFPLMITFTLSHRAIDTLDSLRSALRTAFDKTFSGRWYQTFKDDYDVVGKITSSEVTYGRNGWHPHLHILMFTRIEIAGKWLSVMQAEIGQRWREKVKTLGYSASLAHGVDVTTAESAIADYVSKWGREPLEREWGVDVELAKSNVKSASRGGLTPFQLLGAYAGIQADLDAAWLLLGGDDREAVKTRCGALFAEFWYAYKGRSRLHWGQMKNILELDDALCLYDQENPQPEPDDWTIFMCERGPVWNRIIGTRGRDDLRADLLAVCATRDAWQVRTWLAQHGIHGGIPPDAFERSLLHIEVSNESEAIL